jgi:hypothetical protein
MNVYGTLTGTLTSAGRVTGALSSDPTLSVKLTIPNAAGVPRYEGDYEFTPSDQTQTVAIEGLMARQDIVINPIPSNYGLITWNGSTLTVS